MWVPSRKSSIRPPTVGRGRRSRAAQNAGWRYGATMLLRAPSSGLFASAPLTRQITCHPIYTSLLAPSSPGCKFRRAFRLSQTITTVNLIGHLRVSPAVCWYCPRLRFIGRRYAAVDAFGREQTLLAADLPSPTFD